MGNKSWVQKSIFIKGKLLLMFLLSSVHTFGSF